MKVLFSMKQGLPKKQFKTANSQCYYFLWLVKINKKVLIKFFVKKRVKSCIIKINKKYIKCCVKSAKCIVKNINIYIIRCKECKVQYLVCVTIVLKHQQQPFILLITHRCRLSFALTQSLGSFLNDHTCINARNFRGKCKYWQFYCPSIVLLHNVVHFYH